MSGWSNEDGGVLPNWLTADQKARCYCDDRGWVLVNLDGTEEVVVAANSLNNAGERGHGFNPAGESLDPDRAGAHAQKDLQLLDQDGDGVPSYRDPDKDGDGVPNESDPEEYNPLVP